MVHAWGSWIILALGASLYSSAFSILRRDRNERERFIYWSILTAEKLVTPQCKKEKMCVFYVEFSETVMLEARIWQGNNLQAIFRR